MFVDLDWPLNASSLLSASAELLVNSASDRSVHSVALNLLRTVSSVFFCVNVSTKFSDFLIIAFAATSCEFSLQQPLYITTTSHFVAIEREAFKWFHCRLSEDFFPVFGRIVDFIGGFSASGYSSMKSVTSAAEVSKRGEPAPEMYNTQPVLSLFATTTTVAPIPSGHFHPFTAIHSIKWL